MFLWFVVLMTRRPQRSTPARASSASDVYKSKVLHTPSGEIQRIIVVELPIFHVNFHGSSRPMAIGAFVVPVMVIAINAIKKVILKCVGLD